jgi:hypothetical protein
VSRPSLPAVAAGLGALAAGAGTLVGLSYAGARGVPLSPLHGESPVGPDWPDRHGLRGDPVAGEVDDLAMFARPRFDPDDIHPDVRALYERTAEFGMTLDAVWHHPFRLGARLATRWTSRVEQLNLPGPGGDPKRVTSDLAELSAFAAAEDPRDDPRLWVRTDRDTGAGVFVAVYAAHGDDAERFVNVAVPLPGANLSTVLRVAHHRDGLELTTDCPGGGLYLHTGAGAFRLPASQRFRVLPARDSAGLATPEGVARYDAAVVADQRIRLLGLPLVTVRYAATRG